MRISNGHFKSSTLNPDDERCFIDVARGIEIYIFICDVDFLLPFVIPRSARIDACV